jgi:uncharacterized Zn-binding protein involved in type VI secretion
MDRLPAIRELSRSTSGNIVGNTALTVEFNGQPLALEGSVNSAGATVLAPKAGINVYAEGRLIAYQGDSLSDGTTLLDRKEK